MGSLGESTLETLSRFAFSRRLEVLSVPPKNVLRAKESLSVRKDDIEELFRGLFGDDQIAVASEIETRLPEQRFTADLKLSKRSPLGPIKRCRVTLSCIFGQAICGH